MWRNYFKLIRINPGKVVVPGHGKIDFARDNLPVELCLKLYASGFPYLELTKEGKEKYGTDSAERQDKPKKPKSPVTA